MKKYIGYLVFALLVSVATILISHLVQPQISFNDGLGWDGVKYTKIAHDFVEEETISTKAPFVYRIGVPYLVSIISPNDTTIGFLIINWLFSIINAVLLAILLSRFTNKKWIVYFLTFLFITQWHNYFRFGSFYPVQVDALALTIILSSIFILLKNGISKRDVAAISILTFLGVFVREIAALPALLLVLKSFGISGFDIKSSKANWKSNRSLIKTSAFIPILIFILVTAFIRVGVEPTNTYKFYNAALGILYTKALFTYIHSWIVSYGSILFIPILFRNQTKQFLRTNPVLGNLLMLILVLSFVGGADTSRLAYWGFPVVLACIAWVMNRIKIENNYKLFFLIIIVAQFVAQRIMFIIPDYPSEMTTTNMILVPFGNDFPYLNLFPAHSELVPRVVGFLQWVGVFIVLLFVKNKTKKSHSK
jgi:hypothetical protein